MGRRKAHGEVWGAEELREGGAAVVWGERGGVGFPNQSWRS